MSHPYIRRAGEGDTIWFIGNLVTVKTTGARTQGHATVVEFVHAPGFAPPLHVHSVEDELFYLVSGTARFQCGGERFEAGRGDFVLLPVGLPHTFLVGPGEPLHALLIATPSGFERFIAEAGRPARARSLPDPEPEDPADIVAIAARHGIEILGPPPAEIPL
ncbi:cupin [Acrocarpospora phusangensis]|uniref:Cupin n=1 Tax=Acrocarpospora phusangensis TaxID=1070424 RepID=A0A919QD11_9ACTN|nr:cupin domain-containing protein [Acrocarpospora phusangensis]GIH26692.1 cupin [Acrocarpospora phusangensis]